jgi:CheY-like chemotaxis protein
MTISEPFATRQMLEESWRLRLEETQVYYREATDQYRKLLQAQPDGTPYDRNGALALARQAQSKALAEYTRVLRVFTELTVKGKIPEERPVAESNGVMNVLDLGKISIVDDDESIRSATRALLRAVGYEVQTFASAELFLASDALRETDCLVLDVRMPGIDGLELQRRLNETKSRVPIIFVTAHDDRLHRRIAMDAGAANFFRKPFEAIAFVAAVHAALLSGRSSEASSKPEESGRAPAVRPVSSLRSHRLREES